MAEINWQKHYQEELESNRKMIGIIKGFMIEITEMHEEIARLKKIIEDKINEQSDNKATNN